MNPKTFDAPQEKPRNQSGIIDQISYWERILDSNFDLIDEDGNPMPDDYRENVEEYLAYLRSELTTPTKEINTVENKADSLKTKIIAIERELPNHRVSDPKYARELEERLGELRTRLAARNDH
jgi:hypothetical protein